MDILVDDFGELKFIDARKQVSVEAMASGTMPENPMMESDDEITKFEAIAQEADKVNKNKRIYPKDVLQGALDALQPKIKRKEVFAMSDHPDWAPKLGRIAAVITSAVLNDKNKVVITGEFADNDAADEVKSLLKLGVKVGVSARGYGAYDTNSETGVNTFLPGYEIEGWDFVVYPAANAKVTHFESVDKEKLKADISKEETEMSDVMKTDPIRTLDGLRAAYPELVALLEKPLTDHVATVEAQIADANAKVAEIETEKTVLQGKFDELNGRHETALKGLDEVNGKLKIATDQIADNQATIAKAALRVEIDSFMKDHKYAKHIVINDSFKTLDEVKTHVDAETAKLDAFAESLKVVAKDDVVIVDTPKIKVEDMKKIDKDADPLMDSYVQLASKPEIKKFELK